MYVPVKRPFSFWRYNNRKKIGEKRKSALVQYVLCYPIFNNTLFCTASFVWWKVTGSILWFPFPISPSVSTLSPRDCCALCRDSSCSFPRLTQWNRQEDNCYSNVEKLSFFSLDVPPAQVTLNMLDYFK